MLGRKSFVSARGGRYATWSAGVEGPLVVLLHGWPVSSHHWRQLVPALVDAGFKTLAIDLKGLGESSARTPNFEKRQLGRELLELVDAPSFALVGHDWGGSVALAMAALAPSRVTRLVIEEEVPPGVEMRLQGLGLLHYPTWHGAFHRTPLAQSLIRGREREYLEFFLSLRADVRTLSRADRDHFVSVNRAPSKIAAALEYYRCAAADSAFFRALTLKRRRLQCPSLAIGGASGMGSAVFDSLTQVARSVSPAVVLSRSGHYPAEEQPALFNRHVLRFLRGPPEPNHS